MIIFFLPSNYIFKSLSKWTLVGFCPTFRLFRLSCAYHRPNQTHVLNPEFPVDPTGFAVPSSQDQDTCACFQRSDGMGWLIGWEEKLKGLLMEQIRVTTWMGSLSYCVQGFTGFLNHQLYWAMVEGSCERICSKKGQFWKIFQTVSLEGLTSMHFDVAWESWLDSCGEVWRFGHLATELPTNMSLKLPWSWPLSATTMVDQVLLNTCKVYDHTRKHTWDLKTDPQKTRFLFDIMIFRVNIRFEACTIVYFQNDSPSEDGLTAITLMSRSPHWRDVC